MKCCVPFLFFRLIEQGSKAVSHMMSTLFFPIVPFCLHLFVIACFLTIAILLSSGTYPHTSSYQYQFVKTPFPRIWSNRDMSLFSFWPISPQFCIVKSTKASEKWSHMGEGLGGPLFHALGMVFRLFWGIL